MDWFSRCALAWRLSNTPDSAFCIDALEETLTKGTPEVFNTDQGTQFTSEAFSAGCSSGIACRSAGMGRAASWTTSSSSGWLGRSLKYEEVYLKAYQHVPEPRVGIGSYLWRYNEPSRLTRQLVQKMSQDHKQPPIKAGLGN